LAVCKPDAKPAVSQVMPCLLRNLALLCFFLGATPDLFAFSRKTPCAVRFHVEVDASASDPFTRPVKLLNPQREIYVESSAALSERQIDAVYTYPAADGTSWGALFRLDTSGRKILSQISSSNRGRSFVIFVGTQKQARQLPGDLLIDDMVPDGLLPIPAGLTHQEVLLLQKAFKPLSPAAKTLPPPR
jgi:hypothetical protein